MTRGTQSYRDFFVGLFILGSIGIILGLLVVTSNTLVDRQLIYMRTSTATGLNQDTRVFLQGLQIGRVRRVLPLVEEDQLTFVAALGIDVTFPDGTLLQVPVGTSGVIAEPSPITAAVVRLEIPLADGRPRAYLAPGDTIDSRRIQSALDLLGEVATGLQDQVLTTLRQTEAMLEQSTLAISRSQGVLASTQRTLDVTTPKVEQALQLLASSLKRTDEILSEVAPRVGPIQDSLMATLAQTRSTLEIFDSIARTTRTMLDDNQGLVREALQRLVSTTQVLDHFARQVSRRPTRLLTGVEPPATDTTSNPL